MEKPTLPKGTRDFGPAQMAKRQFIFDNIRKVFQKYGFQPLETPAMENLTTLTGKYGEEGDQLLFKILDSGDYPRAVRDTIKNSKETEEKLRYYFNTIFLEIFLKMRETKSDLTVDNLPSFVPTFNIENDDFYAQARSIILSHKAIVIEDLSQSINFTNAFNRSNYLFDELYSDNKDKINQILNPRTLTFEISEKGLRYDLTVPFARYVVMNRNEIALPFKRYQIQPVWRADKPQKGRYREFYQCDADVVGTESLICEAEIILMIREVFKSLGIQDYTIKINHRGVLAGLAELAGAIENQGALFVAIDKLDKIGEDKVKDELVSKGFSESALKTVFDVLNFKGTTVEKITFLQTQFATSENGNKGLSDLTETLRLLQDYGTDDAHVEFDIALARGLSYYTGCIFEVKINNVAIGSVSGGGRYDNLTSMFDEKGKLSGVGFSFGVDRLYDAMSEIEAKENRALFPVDSLASSKVLICHFDADSKRYGLKVLQTLRENGIAAEVYPDSVKIQKQLDYANKKMIPFTMVIGSDEVKSGELALKDMRAGVQVKMRVKDIVAKLA